MKWNKAPWVIVLALSVLGGCSTTKQVTETIEKNQTQADAWRQTLRNDAQSNAVTVIDRARLSGREVKLANERSMPAIFNDPIQYSTSGQALGEILDILSQQMNMPIRIAESVTSGSNQISDSSMSRELSLEQTWVQVDYQGSVSGLLDYLAQSGRLYWRYNEGQIQFFLYETRHFQVHVPMGSRSITASISGGGSNGGSGTTSGASGQSGSGGGSVGTGAISINTNALNIDPYSAMTTAITSMLMEEGRTDIVRSGGNTGARNTSPGNNNTNTNAAGDVNVANVNNGSNQRGGNRERERNGSRVVVTPELGLVTVTAPPPALEQVASYIDGVNKRFSRNVLINLKIYDVALDVQEGAGFSANLLFERLNRFGLEVVGGAAAGMAGENPGQAILDITRSGSRFNGTQLVAEALSSFGNVSVVTSGQVIAVNGQPAPLQVADEVNYLARSSSGSSYAVDNQGTPGGGWERNQSLEPGMRVVGLTANFLPLIMSDNRIMLQYQLTMSSLLSLDKVGTDQLFIQTPRIASQSLQQQAVVRDGQTLVLFGLEQTNSRDSGAITLGGLGRGVKGGRTIRVVVMQILGGNRDA